jgi:predicted DNA-binding transcriptional regulator AlpA
MSTDDKKLLNVKQVGNYLNLSVSTIDRMLADGEFVQPDYLISNVKKRLWKQSTIDKFLDAQCRNPKSVKEEPAA